jgi:phosphoesterase RecJ-like protein
VKNIPKKLISEIKRHLSNSRKIIILTHKDADGDAIGSMLGLYHFLKEKEFDVTAITPNEYAEFLQWMPGNSDVIRFQNDKSLGVKAIKEADIIFNLDFNSSDRLGGMESYVLSSPAVKILIDHHPLVTSFNDYTISTTLVSSAAELVFLFIKALDGKLKLTKQIAECLFTGIMTDTGCFSYNSSAGNTYNIVAELLNTGINKDDIYCRIYGNFSDSRMRLLGYALDKKLVVNREYKTAYISMTKKELEEHKFVLGDSEGFVNYPLSIKGVVLSALFIEKDDYVKVSFRSKGNFPVNLFSERHFNGGGHLNAAGGESYDSLSATISKFTSLLPEYSKYLKE